MDEVDYIKVIFPVHLEKIYGSLRSHDRVELCLGVYPNICAFFNAVMSEPVKSLLTDGYMKRYSKGVNGEEDQVVINAFRRIHENIINELKINQRFLNETGCTEAYIQREMKALSFELLEDALGPCYDYIFGEAEDRHSRIDRIESITAVYSSEDVQNNLPLSIDIEAIFRLDEFRALP